jgi:hypothetical protein
MGQQHAGNGIRRHGPESNLRGFHGVQRFPTVKTLVAQEKTLDKASSQKNKEIDEALQGIRRGLEDVKNGRTRPVDQAFAQIRRRRKSPRKG